MIGKMEYSKSEPMTVIIEGTEQKLYQIEKLNIQKRPLEPRGKSASKGGRVGCQRDQRRAAVRMSPLSGPPALGPYSLIARASRSPKTLSLIVGASGLITPGPGHVRGLSKEEGPTCSPGPESGLAGKSARRRPTLL